MAKITLEEYERKIRGHDPVPPEEAIHDSIAGLSGFIVRAKEENEELTLLDVRTKKPYCIVYPSGELEFVPYEDREADIISDNP